MPQSQLGSVNLLEGGQPQPQEKDKLEGVVEGEPVDDADQALDDGEEGEDDPVRKPLRVIVLGGAEERLEGVVAGDDEAGDVGQELAAQVEDDEEEVERGQADDTVRLGDAGLLLEVDESGVPGELETDRVNIAMEESRGGGRKEMFIPHGRAVRRTAGHVLGGQKQTWLRKVVDKNTLMVACVK